MRSISRLEYLEARMARVRCECGKIITTRGDDEERWRSFVVPDMMQFSTAVEAKLQELIEMEEQEGRRRSDADRCSTAMFSVLLACRRRFVECSEYGSLILWWTEDDQGVFYRASPEAQALRTNPLSHVIAE